MNFRRPRFDGKILLLIQVVALLLSMPPAMGSDAIDFNRDVRPILSDHCFLCHGPDDGSRAADLRLDLATGASVAGGSSVIVAGDADGSLLFQRIISTDADLQMPPPSSHKELTGEHVDTLRRWIEQGGKYDEHWSLMPMRSIAQITSDVALPENCNQTCEVIDHLVQAELDRRQLSAMPPADPVTLLRRLHLDVTGLVPTPAQASTFLEDPAHDAYELQVDRLLNSPHFGERLAIWWLDLVRYADSVGYHGDQDVSVSPFRDYVIRSFNANKPFDQFTIEQLAGDLLPELSQEQQIASGYNRLGMMSAEGGVQDKEYLAKYIAERVRNVSGTWLGVTMGCCECHDHKFDPLSMREFYQMEAFFADIKERGLYAGANSDGNWGPSIQVPSEQQQQELSHLDQQIAQVQDRLDRSTPELQLAQVEWEKSQPAWSVLKPTAALSTQGVTLTIREDHSVLASGENPGRDVYTLAIDDLPAGTTALRLEVLADPSLPKNGPGRADNGNFVLTEFIARVEKPPDSQPPDSQLGASELTPLRFSAATASHQQRRSAKDNPYGEWSIAAAIDQDAKGAQWGWAILDLVGQAHRAVFEFAEGQSPKAGTPLVIELHQNHDNPTHTLGCFRLWASTSPSPGSGSLTNPTEIEAIVAVPVEQRSEEQSLRLAAHYRSVAPMLQPAREELAKLRKSRQELDATIPSTLVTVAVEPRPIRVLSRGNWMDTTGEIVQPAFPAAIKVPSFSIPQDRRLSRLDLAHWITASDNPLTARVMVNRLWKLYFGVGLSPSLDDTGAQGQPPSHPRLLDYLAQQFVQSGWNIKQTIRAILLSQTYRRSSLATEALLAVDPGNRWLARQGRFRLDAELVRDNALATSGLLVRRIGGPSVKPYQPAGYWAYLNFPAREWTNGTGDQLHRRGLYTHWQRQYLHPSMLAFDAPNREECAANRPRSNTPLQSLALLNDPTFVEAARALAAMVMQDGGPSDELRLEFAFQQVLSRRITQSETLPLLELLSKARAEYQQQPEQVRLLHTVGQWRAPEHLDQSELAAWTAVTRVILNLHESISRY